MSRGARKEGLSRRHRFSARGAFGPVLRTSRKLRGSLTLLHVVPGSPGISRLGIGLTRRVAPSSVLRNRVKRVLRELFRRHGVKAAGVDLVLMLRERIVPGQVPAIAAEALALLDQVAERARP